MATAATVAVRIKLDTQDYDAGIESVKNKAGNLSGTLMSVGKAMVGVGGAATAAFTVPIVGAMVKAGQAASDLVESTGAVERVFLDNSDVIFEYGEIAAEAAGLSKNEFQSMAIVTGSFLKNLGFDLDDAATETISLTERASDMAAVFNTDVDQALAAIQSGLKGEFNPLEQFGVKINAAAIEAKALEMGLADLEGNIDDNAKAQATLALVYEQTADKAGTFKEESQGLAGQLKIAKARFGDAAASIGVLLLPILTKAIEFISGLVEKFTNLNPTIQKVILIVGAVVAAIGPLLVIVGTLIAGIGAIIPIITTVVGAVGGVLIPIILAIVAVVGTLIAIGGALYLAWKNNWGGIRDSLIEIWEGYIKPAFQSIWQWLQVVIPAALQILSDYWTNVLLPAIESVVSWIIEKLVPVFESIFEWLSVNIPIAIEWLKSAWETVLLPALQLIWDYITNSLIPAWQLVFDWFMENIPKAIEWLSDKWTNVLLPAIESVWAFIQNYLMPLFNAVVGFISAVFSLALTVFAGIWENILWPAIEMVWQFLKNNIFPIIEALVDFFNAAFTLALTALAGLWQNVLAPALEKVWEWIDNKIIPVFEKLKNFWDKKFGPIIDKVVGWLGDKLEPAFQGISDVVSSIVGFINDLTTKLKNIKLPAWLTPGSPTPFEIGLLGINDALKEINKKGLPDFRDSLFDLDSFVYKIDQPVAKNIENVNGELQHKVENHYHLNANYKYQSPLSLMDEVRLREAAGV